MKTLLTNPEQIVTIDSKGLNYKRGHDMKDIGVLTAHSILIEDGKILDIIPDSKAKRKSFDKQIDLQGKVILPGLVDCHTHTVFSGSRANEFHMKLGGVTYEEISEKGGGINRTVESVRESSFNDLVQISTSRVNNFIKQGITTLEIKSGYGLSFYDEIKMLQVIHAMKSVGIEIIPTFLGAHTFPKEYKNDREKYLQIVNDELIPYISKNKLAKFCDAFLEKTAFNTKEVESIFANAAKHGFKTRLHTNQFNSIGGIDLAIRSKCKSADHLEIISEEEISKISESDLVAVLLPGVSFSLKYNYAPARDLIDKNSIVALASDFNPGSSHISNISMIMALAALNMKMTFEEILSAFTINAAKALDISDSKGSIEINKDADFAIFNCNNYNEIIYNIGTNINIMTISKGEIIYQQKDIL